jgi:parallel beta-helix repeat protein
LRATLRALRLSLVAGAITVSGVVGTAGSASAATTHVVHPGQSIQSAIDGAASGDTIILAAGTYRENLSITKDNLTILGAGAFLTPPASPGPSTPCDELFADDPSSVPPAQNGICIAGAVDPSTMAPTRYVTGTRITGLHIQNFPGSGIVQLAGQNSRFTGINANDNDEYGLAAFISTGTQMIGNHASGSGEAGLYIGDSPQANATLTGNDVSNNLFGIFQRDAEHTTVSGNRMHDNCVGMLVLADAPGPSGNANVQGNLVKNNNKACNLPEDEGGGMLGGIGILLQGTNDVFIHGNIVTGNTAPAGVPQHAGIGVATGDAGTPPANNTVSANVVRNNNPDLFWDGAGANNTFTHNVCDTSSPSELCS